MNIRFFWIPVRDSTFAEAELNRFLAGHSIVQLEKVFVTSESVPGRSFCVQWVVANQRNADAASLKEKSGKIGYRDVLDEETFRIFYVLRAWRKEKSAERSVPVYTFATNEQFAPIARERIQTPSALARVEGFGQSRIGKNGVELVELCRQKISATCSGRPMKRFGHLMETIATGENVTAAFHKANAGAGKSTEAIVFRENLKQHTNEIVADLRAGQWEPRPYSRFIIHDPKQRLIHTAPFYDRVVHHTLMNVAGPWLEQGAVEFSLACRKRRGNRGAVERAVKCARRYRYSLKLDIRRYFDSVRNGVLEE